MVQKFPLLEVVQACHSLLIPTEKVAIFEVVLSIYYEFYQIGTPHFSLEGVVLCFMFLKD